MIQDATARATRTSARLGLMLRAVVAAPGEGFSAAVIAADRRRRVDARPHEGYTPYVLAAAGGAAAGLLWLKVGGLFGVRAVDASGYRAAYVVATALGGSLVALAAQGLWAAAAARLLRASARDLRIASGLAAFPQIGALALVPLDLAIVGPQTFTTEPLIDSVSTAWAAISIALAAGLGLYSGWLLVRGTAAVTERGLGPAAAAAALAAAVASAVATALIACLAVVA